MLGGDEEAIATATPVFESFGELIIRLGEVGAGQHAKIVNNTLLAANIGLADSALRAGECLGLDQSAFLQLLLASSGRSFGLEVRGRMRVPASFSHGARLLLKDMGLMEAVLGPDDPSVILFRAAGQQFLDQCVAEPTETGR
jgi:3-hydroxyisobutyrate dehydrogenase-like beta-hydroxyacid dehydrogenase